MSVRLILSNYLATYHRHLYFEPYVTHFANVVSISLTVVLSTPRGYRRGDIYTINKEILIHII